MNGLLVVDKPPGMTSHDVVSRLRRALGERRIGHAGTLDPMATGVLVVGVGRATRLLRFVETHEKRYDASITFGVETTSLDADGDPVAEHDASALTAPEVERALADFVGPIEQVPPMVSAIKVGGEALHRKARRGEVVDLAPRPVVIHELVMSGFRPGPRPVAAVTVRCSKGTYVRAIARDVGAALGCGAHLSALRRTAVGPFTEAGSVALEAVTPEAIRPMAEAVAGYPRCDVDQESARALEQGKALPAAGIDGPYAVFGPGGLVAMVEDRGEVARSLCVVSTT